MAEREYRWTEARTIGTNPENAALPTVQPLDCKVTNVQAKIGCMDDPRYYEVVEHELQNRVVRPRLWVKAVAETGGEMIRTRSLYVKLRALQMREQEERDPHRTQQRPSIVWICVLAAVAIIGVAAFVWKSFIE